MSIFVENKNTDINDRHVNVRIFQHPMGSGVFVDFFGESEMPPFTANGQWHWLHLGCNADGSDASVTWAAPFASPPARDLKVVVGAWTTVDPVTAGLPTGRIQARIKDDEFWTDHGYYEDTYKFDGPKVWEEITTPLCEGIFDECFWRLEAKRTSLPPGAPDDDDLGQVSVAGAPLIVPYFHLGLTQAKALVEVGEGGECSLDRARVEIPPGTNKNYVFLSAGHFGQLLWRGGRFASAPLPIPLTEEGTTGQPEGPFFAGTFTYVDRSWQLAPGRTVTRLAMYSTVPGVYPLKIVRRNDATNYDVLVSTTISHAGGGWQYIDVASFAVPGPGHHVAAFTNGGNHMMFNGKARAYAAADIMGSNLTLTEQDAPRLVLGVRAVYA